MVCFGLLAYPGPSTSSWFRYRLVSILLVSFAFSFCFRSVTFAGILSWPCVCFIVQCLSVALHFASLCFALLRFTSLRFALFLLIIESLELMFCALKFKSRKGCDYNLYCSDTDCAKLLPLNKAKLIRYSAARPFFHWFVLSRACMDNQVFFS